MKINLRNEKFGLFMILAALFVIALIALLYLQHRQQHRLSSIQQEGHRVVRLLANMPYQLLVTDKKQNRILDLLNNTQSEFAYAAVVDLNGQPLAVSSSGKANIPNIDFTDQKSLWISEKTLELPAKDKTILEFRAPLLNQGELAGYVRLGYFEPQLDLTDISFIAQLALPVFLLVPFTYLLIRRELQPLKQASMELQSIMHKQQAGNLPSLNEKESFQDFMTNFKHFVHEIDRRFQILAEKGNKTQAANMALRYQQQRIESTLQTMPDAILVLDESGIATFANSKLPPLVDTELDKILGHKPQQWCQLKELCNFLAAYQAGFSRFNRSNELEIHPSNHLNQTIQVQSYPLFTPRDSETICGSLIIFRDITAKVLADQARDQFISHVAHELKSPLNVIHMYAESLLDPDLAEQQRITTVNVINDEVDRLSHLIANLLNISKIEAGSIALDLQRVKLNEFLEDTFASVARNGQYQNLQFNIDLPRNLPNIQLDKNLLRIALNNILTNAVKYNKPNGSVTLTAEEDEDSIRIKISDTGIGVSPKDQQHIFEKFYRSDDDQVTERSGHGLGLTLAKDIVELHQGKLILHSTLGSGSEFIILLKKTSSFLKSMPV